MKTDFEIKTGNWLLVAGSRAIVPTLDRMIGRLAESGPVRVVDCGYMFDIFIAGQWNHGGMDALDRIKVYNAFDCHEMLSVLESLEAGPAPFVVLDLLRTFYYPNVHIEERKRLLGLCLEHLDRLEKGAGGLVSLHLPKVLCQAEAELLEMVTRAAKATYHVETAATALSEVRVF